MEFLPPFLPQIYHKLNLLMLMVVQKYNSPCYKKNFLDKQPILSTNGVIC